MGRCPKNRLRNDSLKVFSGNLSKRHLKALDKLESMGVITSKCEGIRIAVAFWLKDIFKFEEKIDIFLEDDDPKIVRVPGNDQPFKIILNKNYANRRLE